jgi:exopolysaccharide production protein ExoQ
MAGRPALIEDDTVLDVTANLQHDLAPAPDRAFLSENVRQFLGVVIIALMTIQVLGPITIVVQVGVIGLLFLAQPGAVLARLPSTWPVLLFPFFTLATTLWSDSPSVTGRYSLQLVITAIAAVVVAASLSPRRFIGATYVGTAFVALASIISGNQGPSDTGPVLIGLTGSKNQMAFLAQLLLACCVLMVLDRRQPRWMRVSVLVFAPLAFQLLLGAHSATGILTAIGGSAFIIFLVILRSFPPGARVAAVIGVLIVVTPFVVLKDEIMQQAQSISKNLLNKDTSLTGRTYLWRQADRLVAQRPLVGHGYRAVWLGQTIESNGLLRWAGKLDGRGFNFHSTYRETAVDSGFVGVGLFLLMVLLTGWRLWVGFLRNGELASAFMLATFVTYMSRSFTELLIVPFNVTTMLLFAFATYGGVAAASAFHTRAPARS